MRKKKKSSEQLQQELKHQRMTEAGYIQDRFPDVKEIIFNFKFEDPDGKAISPTYKPLNETHRMLPQHLAFFEFDCKHYECVRGGFDLTSDITTMIRKRELEVSNQIMCQGWQDRERINKHRCLLKLTYNITILYNDAVK